MLGRSYAHSPLDGSLFFLRPNASVFESMHAAWVAGDFDPFFGWARSGPVFGPLPRAGCWPFGERARCFCGEAGDQPCAVEAQASSQHDQGLLYWANAIARPGFVNLHNCATQWVHPTAHFATPKPWSMVWAGHDAYLS
jgi:hypothetical protein